ncbi:MAG: septum formation inhibitor-activating ATPase [Gemmatimonadota bacterium]|nr:septum formation inhibitor-activating ATPase [Gemmatimonadota bacterium]
MPKFGGVDPLGLRQVNFDLMDEVFPGLNNVARHIRPFVVVSWAWRRANQLAQKLGTKTIKVEQLQDFVDRIEVIYVWSQFLRRPKADLPGRLVLAPLLQATEFKFGGASWLRRRKARAYSTALSAPINYGPGLRMLGWIQSHPEDARVMLPNPAASSALDAFEGQIKGLLTHDAFSEFGPVVVTSKQALRWSEKWALEHVTDAERIVMAELLHGTAAPVSRRSGMALMLSAAGYAKTTDSNRIRAVMTGSPSKYAPRADLVTTREAWRRVQLRQLFRLALEAFFHWTIHKLQETPDSIEHLVGAFLDEAAPPPKIKSAGAWIKWLVADANSGPTEHIENIQKALATPMAGALAGNIAAGLAFCLAEISDAGRRAERSDRLPLHRARQETEVRAAGSVSDFVQHILESWVLAQHAYWSVGRGLADARVGGKTLLRLKIILDEGGWTLTPGVSPGSAPQATPDRLHTAVSLAAECGLFTNHR